ncbi:MAG: AAA family ATPase [Frankiaceae bacterium]|nr:AAA family ATPase [Frankiaceae bacterium]
MNEASPTAAVGGGTTAERKVLTLLFVDLTGYTRLTTTRDPEHVLLTVGPLLADLRAIAADHGGHVPSVQGDGFLAVFGAPTAHADDPRRAVEAAVAMGQRVRSRRDLGEDVPDIHIGIASGEVLVTAHGGQHDVIGAPVNLAARLSDAAAPGEVLVDETSAALTAEDALFGPARAVSLAGFSGTVRALPLVGVGRRPSSVTVVGREQEHAQVDRALEAVRMSRTSSVVIVVGDAGAGKSRLVESWVERQQRLLVLRGSCRPYGSPLPLSAISEAVTRAADALRAEHLTGESSDALDAFLSLLPRERRTGGHAREPDEAVQVAARRLLTALSRTRPAVLVLEDVHWGDESLLDAIRLLHTDPVPGALLVVATSRAPLADVPAIAVPALSPNEIARIVEVRVGAPPSEGLLRLLVQRSAGNPLWLVECLALLKERGQLTLDGTHSVVVRESADDSDVPDSIRMLVAARLDSLSPVQKAALQRASVWPADIAISDWPGDVADIAALVGSGLLEQREGDVVRFSHGLVREAVYRSMPRGARVTEHEALLARTADPALRAYAALEIQRLDVVPDEDRRRVIAGRAVTAVVEHARHLRLSHTRAAGDVLVRATDLIDVVDSIVPQACAGLLTELAEIRKALEDGAGSREAASRAVTLAALASHRETAVDATLALGEAMLGIDNERARSIASELLGDECLSESQRGRAWTLLGGSHAYDDVGELTHCLEMAFAQYEAAPDADAAAATARQLAFNLSVTAGPEFDRWFSIATEKTSHDHAHGQGVLALVSAVVAGARGEWEEAWAAATSAIELTERIGLHRPLVDAVSVAVEAATATGRRGALPGLLTQLDALIEGRRPRLQITGLCASAPALVLLGRDAQAEDALARARALLASVGPNEATMFWTAQGAAALLADRPNDAEVAYGHAEELAEELGHALYAQGCRLHRLTAQARVGSRPGLRSEVLALARTLAAAGARPLADTAHTLARTLAE